MWHAFRSELAYQKAYLLGGLGLAAGVAALVSVVFYLIGDEGPSGHAASGIRGMFFVMAPMIVGFIAQSFRFEERRTRLLLAGPVTPRQIAGASVLLTVALLGVSVLAAGLMVGLGVLFGSKLEPKGLQMIGYVGGLLFMMMQLGLLIQEAVAARRQGRVRAAIFAWAGVSVGALVMYALSFGAIWGSVGWIPMNLWNLIVAAAAGAASVVLYGGRTDFTR